MTLSRHQRDALEADPGVDFVSPDRPVRASNSVSLLAGDTAPMGARRIEAATAGMTREASSVNVAVIDTGIDLGHPDRNVVHGRNCVGPGPAQDDDGHGTHVAGTLAARNNGTWITGEAPGTRLSSVKALAADGSARRRASSAPSNG